MRQYNTARQQRRSLKTQTDELLPSQRKHAFIVMNKQKALIPAFAGVIKNENEVVTRI